MESEKPKVCITGVSGYVGSQVCLAYLQNGTFKVRGTVRNTKNPKKIEPLKKAFGEHFDQLELVEADLDNEQSIIDAIEGCTYVVHTASPFPITKVKDEQTLIKPAVEGTLSALRGAQKHKCKRVVVTSSVAAIWKTSDPNQLNYTTDDWTDTKSKIVGAYEKSKTMAERAAWDFVEKLPADEKFELVCINPGLVLGPNLVTSNFSSGDIIKQFMLGKMPGLAHAQVQLVDVRDVALAHLNALLIPEAAGNRFMLVQGSYWFKDISTWLIESHGTDYPKIPKKIIAKWMIGIASWFMEDAKFALQVWGKEPNFDNTKTKELLKVPFREMGGTVQEMATTLIETGYVPDQRKK